MKHVIFILIFFVFSNLTFAQNTKSQDSSETNCKFYQGKLSKEIGDSATYIYFISKYNSFIEISTLTWGSIITKYKVERQTYGQIFTVSKTIINRYDSTSTCFIAIDSITLNEKMKEKKDYENFLNGNIFIKISKKEPLALHYFSTFIARHNLQNQYFNFKPNLFVAWFETKSKGKLIFNPK